MRKHTIVHFWLCGLVLLACNPGPKLNQGAGPRGQAFDAPNGDDAEPLPTAATSAEGSESVAENRPNENMDPELDTEDEKAPVAMEPTPIGGGYLTCLYPAGQARASETYRMDCEVGQLPTANSFVMSASFYKVDAQGNRFALPVLAQDLGSLKWTLQENASTVSINRVQLVLSILGAINVTLETTVAAPR